MKINYDFATKRAFNEDDGPHSGFKSFVSEQSMSGSVIIQSLVETRYGQTVEMRVLSSITGSYGGMLTGDENYCFFGQVPILRFLDAQEAPNLPPEQWTPFGDYLWWWIPRAALSRNTINVLDVPMTRTSSNPATFIAAQTPNRFHFSGLQFDSRGYLTLFSAKDPSRGLDLNPSNWLFQNNTTVDGLNYYLNVMGQAMPDDREPDRLPTSLPGTLNLLLFD